MSFNLFSLDKGKERKALKEAKTGRPNQLGKLTDRPTKRMDISMFSGDSCGDYTRYKTNS